MVSEKLRLGNSVPLGDEEDGLELKLTLNGEVLNR